MNAMQPDAAGATGVAGWPNRRVAASGTGLGFRLSRQFQASESTTREALIAVTGKLRARGVDQGALESLELVLAEILNNITEHAYAGDGGSIDLSVIVAAEGLRCRVADQGRRAPESVLAAQTLPEAADLPEGGWGWYLVNSLSEGLSYQQENGWNILRLTVPWDA